MRRGTKNTPRKWVHLTAEPELVKRLDEMIRQDESDRSKFVRRLIRQEWERRQVQAALAQRPTAQ